jgi:PEP-CTERM motif
MVAGTDITSMHRSNGPVVVDDFIVNKPEIVGFRWWGSYFAAAGQGRGQARDVTFELSYHSDCPAGAPISAQCPGDPRGAGAAPTPYAYSTPGQPYSFQVLTAQETFFGTTTLGEDVYEYFVMLPTTWAATPGAIAWLDVAWAAGQFGTDADGSMWGWHESDEHHLDFAVQTDSAANRLLPQLGSNPHLGPWNVLQGRDMAFQVITVPEPISVLLVALGLLGVGTTCNRTRRVQG